MPEFRRLTYKTPDGAWGIEGVSLLTCPARLYGTAAKLCNMECLCEDVYRAKDAELLAAQGEGDGASDVPGAPGGSGAAPADPDAGETLADQNWRNEPVEPGDQDPNAPFRTPAEHADRADAPTQAEVNAEIDREDDMDSSADAPDPNKKD